LKLWIKCYVLSYKCRGVNIRNFINDSLKKFIKMQQCIKIYYSIFIWSSTCFGQHTAHHQETKTALAASGFSYVGGCCKYGIINFDIPLHLVGCFFMNCTMMHGFTNTKFINETQKVTWTTISTPTCELICKLIVCMPTKPVNTFAASNLNF
jgi:hypothetical protein